jgi:FecR protein
MKKDYLWDSSGDPDPEVQGLEKALGQFRAAAGTPNFPAINTAVRERQSAFAQKLPRFVAASVLSLALTAGAVLLLLPSPAILSGPGWDVARLEGTPSVGRFALTGDAKKVQLRVGDLLETDSSSRASVAVAEIGELYVDPGSRLRLLETGSHRKRIAMEFGTIHAAIWAPPGEFVVDTPSATAVDLGCAYTLKVTEDGSGTLQTTLGWVGFHHNGRDSFIPAGAMCLTRTKEGPGTPFFEDASAELLAALHALDFEQLAPPARRQTLQTALRQARPRDAFTLWHLLARVNDAERALVYDRLAFLVTPPSGVTRKGALRLDPKMLDTWWNAFGLGDIEIWRFWEQNEAPRTKRAAR